MRIFPTSIAGIVFAAGLAFSGMANAEMMEMNVDLTGSEEVPPVETSATGEIEVSFDSESRKLSWELDYSGLSSDATAAHFHGPADPGENAPPVVPVEEFADGSEGSAELTEEQAEQLMAGKMYFNLHTEDHPNGELRGQVTAARQAAPGAQAPAGGAQQGTMMGGMMQGGCPMMQRNAQMAANVQQMQQQITEMRAMMQEMRDQLQTR